MYLKHLKESLGFFFLIRLSFNESLINDLLSARLSLLSGQDFPRNKGVFACMVFYRWVKKVLNWSGSSPHCKQKY